MLFTLLLLISLYPCLAAQDLSQSDTIFMYTILKDKMVVLEQKYDLRLNGMQEKIEKQQEEIINLRKNQEELRSELGECIVEVKRVATPKDVQTLPNNIIVQKKIASHEKNFVTLKSSVRSIETTMRGVQKALFRQKLFGKSCHSKHNNVTIARLQELEKQFTNLSKG